MSVKIAASKVTADKLVSDGVATVILKWDDDRKRYVDEKQNEWVCHSDLRDEIAKLKVQLKTAQGYK